METIRLHSQANTNKLIKEIADLADKGGYTLVELQRAAHAVSVCAREELKRRLEEIESEQ